MIYYSQKRLKNIYLLEGMNYKDYIESIQDFPKEGILYRDIQPLLEDNAALMVQAIIGKPSNINTFFFGNRFDPPRASIIAMC